MNLSKLKIFENITSWLLIGMMVLLGYLTENFKYLLIILTVGLAFQLLLFILYKRVGEEKAFVNRKKWPFLVGLLVICYLVFDQYLA